MYRKKSCNGIGWNGRLEEVENEMKLGINGKPPGMGGINLELNKYGEEKLWKLVHSLFNRIVKG